MHTKDQLKDKCNQIQNHKNHKNDNHYIPFVLSLFHSNLKRNRQQGGNRKRREIAIKACHGEDREQGETSGQGEGTRHKCAGRPIPFPAPLRGRVRALIWAAGWANPRKQDRPSPNVP